jgi:hypothetical protein
MGPVLVIGDHPRVELCLRVGNVVEDFAGQEPFTHRAMPPLNLARRRRRTWRPEDVFDPVPVQIRSNSTSPVPGPNRPVNTLDVILTPTFPSHRNYEVVTNKAPIYRRPTGNGSTPSRRNRFKIVSGPINGSARRNSTMSASTSGAIWCGHDTGRDGLSTKPFEPFSSVVSQPVMHRLASDFITAGDIGHRRTVEDFENSFQTLFHSIELHQHECRTTPQADPQYPKSVGQEPEQVSPTYRNCPKSVAPEPEPHGPSWDKLDFGPQVRKLYPF